MWWKVLNSLERKRQTLWILCQHSHSHLCNGFVSLFLCVYDSVLLDCLCGLCLCGCLLASAGKTQTAWLYRDKNSNSAAWPSRVSQINSLNMNSSEDIKPPPGLTPLGNMSSYQCSSPGSMSKHLCAICGDRSSGTTHRCLSVFLVHWTCVVRIWI